MSKRNSPTLNENEIVCLRFMAEHYRQDSESLKYADLPGYESLTH